MLCVMWGSPMISLWAGWLATSVAPAKRHAITRRGGFFHWYVRGWRLNCVSYRRGLGQVGNKQKGTGLLCIGRRVHLSPTMLMVAEVLWGAFDLRGHGRSWRQRTGERNRVLS